MPQANRQRFYQSFWIVPLTGGVLVAIFVLTTAGIVISRIGPAHATAAANPPATTTDVTTQSAAAPAAGTAAMSPAQMDANMAASIKAFPAKTTGLGAQVLAPTLLPDGTKQFALTAQVVEWETYPGHTVEAWAYNGTVPGPTIRVNPGDKVRIVLANKLPEPTAMHLHGLRVPNAMDGVPYITQPPIDPGQSFTYSFVAQGPAVGMYHSHFDTIKQDSNGLYGAILVGQEPVPTGVTVSQELPFMLNDSGTIGLSINGKAFPATAPVLTHLGDYILVDYYNAGEMAHPIHLHGIPQMVIAEDGFAVPQPYMVDTLSISPGQRFSVLIHADQQGTWAWHCHILSHAEDASGMIGMVTALVIQ